MNDGYEWVVDIDIEQFFDKVNHDKLIQILREQVNDSSYMNNVHSRDGFYCELLLCLLISYNKFTLSNIGFLLTVDGNFRWLE